jgi:integrase
VKGYLRARDRRRDEGKKKRLRADAQNWLMVVEAGYDIDGKRQQKYRSFTGDRATAEQKLRDFIDEVKSGFVIDERLTIGAYLAKWLAHKGTEGLAARTLLRYEGIVRDYLTPTLGSVPLAKLGTAHVKDAIGRWRSSKRKDRKKGALSERTIFHIFSTLKSALADAERDELVRRNVCKAMRAPSKGQSAVHGVDETAALALIEHLDDSPLGLPTRIALLTGLRRGELLATRWSDVDLDGGTLAVRRSLETAKDDAGNVVAHFKAPKTEKSQRVVALPAGAVSALRSYRALYAQKLLADGIAASDEDLIFPEPDEYAWSPRKAWIPDVFSAAFYYRVSKSGLRKVSFHGLRHSYASIALRAGVPLKVVSDALGHTSVKTTGDLYTEVLGDLQRDAANRIDDIFERARAKRSS